MIEVKRTEDWAFFFLFFGGNLVIFNAIVGLIIALVQGNTMLFLDGLGYFEFIGAQWGLIVGGTLNIIIGILALLSGLKLFTTAFRNILTKIDVAIVGLVFIILGAGTFTTGGLILVVAGIYCFIYRLTIEGANNPKAK